MRQAGLLGLSEQLKPLSDCGDPMGTMARVVDFEMFRPALEKALAYGDGAKGGRPPYDPMAMFKALILAAQNTVSNARMEFLIRDRLSWLRFLGFDLGAATPDENTIRLFREKLTRAGAIDTLFTAFDRSLRERGYLPMGGQIVDATLVAAPKQRNTALERVSDQGREACGGDLAGRTGQGGAEGYGCALDAEVRQGTSAARWPAGGRHRQLRLWLWLQEFDRDLPALQLYPTREGHRWRALRRADAARRGGPRQHRLRHPTSGRTQPIAAAPTKAG